VGVKVSVRDMNDGCKKHLEWPPEHRLLNVLSSKNHCGEESANTQLSLIEVCAAAIQCRDKEEKENRVLSLLAIDPLTDWLSASP
jgi:hypothetical protein